MKIYSPISLFLFIGLSSTVLAKDPLYVDNERQPVPGHIEIENFAAVGGGSVPVQATPRTEAGAGESIYEPESGARANYAVDVAEGGRYEVKIRFSRNAGGVAPLRISATAGGSNRVLLSDTKSVNNFQTVKTDLNLRRGEQTFTLNFDGSANIWQSTYINWMAFRKITDNVTPEEVIVVSPTIGDDNGRPFKTLQRAFDRVAEINSANPLHGPIEIRLDEGYHEITKPIQLTAAHTGTGSGPVTMRKGRGPHSAIVGAGRKVPLSTLVKVTDSASLGRLKENARGSVYRARLDDADWNSRFIRRVANSHYEAAVSYNGAYLMLARLPNKGLELAVEQNGNSFKTNTRIDATRWRNEFNRNRDMYVSGHITSDEFQESAFVSAIGADGRISLENYNNFTQSRRKIRVLNVLAELDMPGEWYYDKNSKDFYIWPLSSLDSDPEIRVGANFMMLTAQDIKYWTIRDLVFSDVGGTFNFDGPNVMVGFNRVEDIIFGGNTVRNTNARVAARWDNCIRCIITGNDFYDSGTPFGANGAGSRLPVQPSQTEFTNNHIYRLRARAYGGGGIGGPGVRFANNLIHGVQAGQSYNGSTDLLMELNEWYDLGYELGDWNVAYVGASYYTLGNLVRHNFVHNHVRAPYRRRTGAFRYDDGAANGNFVGNILYKAGSYGFAVASHAATLTNNIVVKAGTVALTSNRLTLPLSGLTPIRANVPEEFRKQLEDVPDPIKPAKNTYIYNAQNVLQQNRYWETPYFAYKYPLIDSAYNINPFVRTNFELTRNYMVEVSTPLSGLGTGSGGPYDDVDIDTPLAVNSDAFVNLDYLDMRFNPGFQRQSGFYDIPFQQIGLYKDEFRKSIPHKNTYRAGARLKWSDNAGVVPENVATHNYPYPDRAFNRRVVYDAGSYTSPLWPGSALLTPQTNGSYGWTDTSGIGSRDRGRGNRLNTDINFGSDTRIFEQDVENGPWYALVTFGDTLIHDSVSLRAEDLPIEPGNENITTQAGQYINKFVYAYVKDGRFSLQFADNGGQDPNWAITRIIMQNTPFEGQASVASLSVKDMRIDESAGTAAVQVSLTPAAASNVSVLAFTRNTGSAKPGEDFYGTTQTLSFAPGELVKTFNVKVLDDTVMESDETFNVKLVEPNGGASIIKDSAVVTVIDNDLGTAPTLSVGSVSVNEGVRTVSVPVTLSSSASASVTAFTRRGTAIGGGQDYFGITRTISFRAGGPTTQTMTFNLNDDSVAETTETMTVRLINAVGADIATRSGTVTILDND